MKDLVVRDVHKAFGAHVVLDGIELSVPSGSLTAILGASGSGKTTLLRVLAGFERADRGHVALGDLVVEGGETPWVPPERRRIGYVPQDGSLFPHLTVRGNIEFGVPRRRRGEDRAGELLDLVGMSSFGQRYPHQLSGGQQQRVALARALAMRPDIVLLDEPFSSLDSSLRASVRSEVKELLRAAGMTAVLVTHDQDEALSLADRVAVIRDGRIRQCDTPHGIYAAPADPDLARFVGEANLIAGTIAGDRARTALGDQRLRHDAPAAGNALVLVRPEQLLLGPADGPGVGCRILNVEYYGHDAVIRIQLERDVACPVLLVRASGRFAIERGATVTVGVEGSVVAWPVPA